MALCWSKPVVCGIIFDPCLDFFVFTHFSIGALIQRDLAPGEVFKISSGCLVAFESSVEFDVEMMKGVKNVLFGGEGLFVTTLQGPGRVWISSLPYE
jgi:uncharacterized protein (AIM24 family)